MEEGKEDGTLLLLLLPLSITRRRRRKKGATLRERGTRLTDGIYLLFFSGTRPDSRPKLFTSSTFSSSFLKLFFLFSRFHFGTEIFFFLLFLFIYSLMFYCVNSGFVLGSTISNFWLPYTKLAAATAAP
jgi:hypothetical protein